MNSNEQAEAPRFVELPGPTGWPLTAAFGLTLVFAGLVTHIMVSALGAVTLFAGLVGWFRQVLPHAVHVLVPVEKEVYVPPPLMRRVLRLQVGELEHRAHLPLKIYPYRAGIWGGLVGGAAMAILAILYGIITQGSVWYAVNLLAAAGSARISAMNHQQFLHFDTTGLVLAIIIHGIGSALVGLLYGIASPMFPRHPLLLGGILAPLFWTGILYSGLGIIDPALQARIHWVWFVASQFAFGLVAGFVVARHTPISTMQSLPFAARAGIKTPGLTGEK